MKRTNLEKLLYRYITGEVSGQVKVKIEVWLDVKKTDQGSELILDEEDEEKLFRLLMSSDENIENIKRFRPANPWIKKLASLFRF